MKVAAIGRPATLDTIRIEHRPDPKPAPGQVLVRVRASSLNYHDHAVVTGRIPTPDGRVPMSDGAGEVLEVGDGVSGLQPGDRVMSLFHPNWPAGGPTAERLLGVPGDQADGFAAELVAVPEDAVTRMPRGMGFAEAATLPCAALTAWRALMVEAQIRPGDVVLTQGTGGLSLFAVQFARAAGATVIATSSSDSKLERLRALGADHLVNYRTEPDWGKRAVALTDGRGVDAVVDVGGAGTIAQSLAAVRVGGHISIIGALDGWSGTVPIVVATLKNVTIKGLTVGSRHEQEQMVRAVEANGIRPVIDSTFDLDRIADAFRHQESQTHFGKISLVF